MASRFPQLSDFAPSSILRPFAAVLVVGALSGVSGCSLVADQLAKQNETDVADVTCDYTATTSASREVSLPGPKPPTEPVHLTLATNAGDIAMDLDPSKAPCAVNAISHLAKEKFYHDTTCHRLTTAGLFVLQCGDPSGTGAGGPGFEFRDEYPVNQSNSTSLYKAGTVAMANSGRNTNGSQFFIVYKNSKLAPNYTVLGTLTPESLETVKAIADKGTADGTSDGAPAAPVDISAATVS